MATLNDYETVKKHNQTFVLVPESEFLELQEFKNRIPNDDTIPHEVAMMYAEDGYTTMKAWRIYLRKTQEEIAKEMGILQPSYQRIENGTNKPQTKTLEKAAKALGVSLKQLTLDD